MYLNIKRKTFVIWSICLLFLCIGIILISSKIDEISFGKKIVLNENTLNLSSYYAEYDVTVISNKNTNTYSVKEWYKENLGSKIEYLDYMENIVSVVTNPTSLYISNNGNKASILTDNIYTLENVLSLATYINIFNKDITCGCTKDVYQKDSEINIIYSVCGKENCMQSVNLKHMAVTSFELNIKDNVPITYTVYTENKKEYVCIVYNKFETNIVIDDNIFSISK